jgi:hypothetical protein
VAYRGDAGDVCEAPSAEGPLRAEFAARHVRLAVADRSIDIADAFATAVDHHRSRAAKDRRLSFRIAGRLIVARGVPREGLGLWLELDPDGPRAGVRRIFGVEPVNLLEPAGLAALAALDRLAQRVRQELADFAPDVRRAIELGPAAAGGLDKVLVVEHADRSAVYARRLFRDRARLVITAHGDGRVAVGDRRATPRPAAPAVPSEGSAPAPGAARRVITVRSRHGITVVGDHVRFTDPQGTDLARVSIPWIAYEDRVELARRIGQRIDHEQRDAAAWPPRLAVEPEPG